MDGGGIRGRVRQREGERDVLSVIKAWPAQRRLCPLMNMIR